jgi:hypothetical protein
MYSQVHRLTELAAIALSDPHFLRPIQTRGIAFFHRTSYSNFMLRRVCPFWFQSVPLAVDQRSADISLEGRPLFAKMLYAKPSSRNLPGVGHSQPEAVPITAPMPQGSLLFLA